VAGGMGMTLGNSAVPLGGFVDVLAAYRFNLSPKVRLELGLEGRFFRNIEATHISLGLPVGFGFVLARNVEMTTHLALGPTWFLFDSPFFPSTNAWGVRYELGVQFPVANRVIFGTAPLGFSLVGSQSVGLLTMWEPRIWVGVAL
jgi:hypothetical protein